MLVFEKTLEMPYKGLTFWFKTFVDTLNYTKKIDMFLLVIK